jgi:hypothetical protein
MIQVGSKGEVELLLALFGSHAQPSKKEAALNLLRASDLANRLLGFSPR